MPCSAVRISTVFIRSPAIITFAVMVKVTVCPTAIVPIVQIRVMGLKTPAVVEERYGVPPQRYPDLAALVGESSDNLPGIPGVGNKTAAKWITQYGNLDGIVAEEVASPPQVIRIEKN